MWHCRLVLVPRHAAVRATRAARVGDREIHRLSASPSPHHRHSVSLSLRSIDCRPRHQPLLPLQQPASRSLSTASQPTAPCTSEQHPLRRGWCCPPIARIHWCVTTSSLMPCSAFV
ncbi:hypothetical protein BC831DRAFT_485347 [Entophlyctis helioformis]|nr:hypothetical protein BC831DRAFT_485347 [Entophlyctis helioformis]